LGHLGSEINEVWQKPQASTYSTTVRTTATITLTTYGDLITHTRGRQHNATGTEFSIPDNVYADNSNIYFCSREDEL
jgi:hypothetical protein